MSKIKFYRGGKWDKEGVKNYLALPCFNAANAIDIAEITEDTSVVKSTIGQASELLQYKGENGYTTELIPKLMDGGGQQVAVKPSYIKSIRNQTNANH
ncbi:hypothetical protein [Photobacterium alginatilyticum]|uniref:Uncharacterized protein n=1 Tax=Photobacterium alginatilyticum TaxID=1775171 RepID=A0ABW9YQ34_9GAMM|nr:hypothetical protein [Photobacterium alginatilyticum]NBI55951.1 hypothetical protein [Photobacterium alginatilyticum]